MGKSVPSPQYYTPEDTSTEVTKVEDPAEMEVEDTTDIKRQQQQSLYFSEKEADADTKTKKSIYSGGTQKTLASKE